MSDVSKESKDISKMLNSSEQTPAHESKLAAKDLENGQSIAYELHSLKPSDIKQFWHDLSTQVAHDHKADKHLPPISITESDGGNHVKIKEKHSVGASELNYTFNPAGNLASEKQVIAGKSGVGKTVETTDYNAQGMPTEQQVQYGNGKGSPSGGEVTFQYNPDGSAKETTKDGSGKPQSRELGPGASLAVQSILDDGAASSQFLLSKKEMIDDMAQKIHTDVLSGNDGTSSDTQNELDLLRSMDQGKALHSDMTALTKSAQLPMPTVEVVGDGAFGLDVAVKPGDKGAAISAVVKDLKQAGKDEQGGNSQAAQADYASAMQEVKFIQNSDLASSGESPPVDTTTPAQSNDNQITNDAKEIKKGVLAVPGKHGSNSDLDNALISAVNEDEQQSPGQLAMAADAARINAALGKDGAKLGIYFDSALGAQTSDGTLNAEKGEPASIDKPKQQANKVDPWDGKGAQHDISTNGVEQTSYGDCFFDSALASFAGTKEGQQKIKGMIKENHNGSFTVTFPGDKDHPVTVSVNQLNKSQTGDSATWANIIETAFLLYDNSNNLSTKHLGPGGALSGSASIDDRGALQLLTGQDASTDGTGNTSKSTLSGDLEYALTHGHIVTAATKGNVPSPDSTLDGTTAQHPQVGDHEYSVVGFDPKTQTVTVRNPWGENSNTADGQMGDTVGSVTNIGNGEQTMSLTTFMKLYDDVNFSDRNQGANDWSHFWSNL